MSYQVLARKWRPQRFDDVVGQQAVTRTLKNALSSGRLAQAFVFAGPRGVGKTTTARILARALNCEKGPTGEPCGVCDACVEIAEGRDIDVLEIDAATHTGVDNVREVIIAGLGIMRFTPAGFLGCRVARAEVAALLGRLDDTPMCFVPRDTEALQLLVTYARGIAESVPLATPELQRLAVSHMHDLMAAIVAATRGGRAIAEGRGIAAARLRAIMIDIRAHLGDGDLSVAEVAQRQRMTPRYVHKLFENEGFTFSSFVRDQRIACAHRMLSDPRLADRTIGSIAFDVGFGDLSYFHRTFRRRHGRPLPARHRPGHRRGSRPRRRLTPAGLRLMGTKGP